MSISIGTSTPSSAWETHAAWLRLRGDSEQLLDHVLAGADRRNPRVLAGADLVSVAAPGRLDPCSGVNIRM